ncbi:hypothetical protein HPP92_028300 [Vanilla planifolia]|uniref:Uncharacterized protein n=1 Tax=Vanilla planifolia TaxID=51239 RepID=A0A835U2X0_VANPL|nr:hypothetical protein HPP92_028300 [Vanilla planifolia]
MNRSNQQKLDAADLAVATPKDQSFERVSVNGTEDVAQGKSPSLDVVFGAWFTWKMLKS